MPVQGRGSYSLDSPVQDILDERPELLKGFMEAMDKENVLGKGWMRWAYCFYSGLFGFSSF